jgi:transcriptional regulator with XRE-family HTH domain
MSSKIKLKNIRESQNLTQEELSEKSGISVRTIQRIEAGQEPKGYTLRVLAQTLEISEKELQNTSSETEISQPIVHQPNNEKTEEIDFSKVKLINLSSLPFVVLPVLNIVVPVILMYVLKMKHPIIKQIISVQILWTIVAPIVFMIGIFLKLGRQFTLALIVVIVLSNLFIIIRNAMEIDSSKKLYYRLNFSFL